MTEGTRRLEDDPVDDSLVRRPARETDEQLPRLGLGQAAQAQAGQPVKQQARGPSSCRCLSLVVD
jgi:hypothetical protein